VHACCTNFKAYFFSPFSQVLVTAHNIVSRPGTVQPNGLVSAHFIFFPAKPLTKSFNLWTSKIHRKFSEHANGLIQISMSPLFKYLSNEMGPMSNGILQMYLYLNLSKPEHFSF
jgi:hypothetical protein